MPVIDLPLNKINNLLGKQLTINELEEYCLQLGADIENKHDDSIKVEYNPNRPDYSSVAGFTRDLKGIMEIETGLPKYQLKKGAVVVNVEESVSKVRPFIQCAIIRDASLTEEDIAELMKTQETLHWVVGRDRKKASIGIHDMKDLRPPFKYAAVDAKSHAFLPLGEEKEMTPAEICTEHPKGKKYAHLVNPKGQVPYLTDKNDGVLSFPPIINGVLTLVTTDSKDLFIDVTGTDENAVRDCLEILTSSFAELGYAVETVTIKYPEKTLVTPTFEPQIHSLKIKSVKKLLGLDLSKEELEKALLKARFDIDSSEKAKRNSLSVIVPSFRNDILHEVDLIEEVAISYGYHNIEPILDDLASIGKRHPVVNLQNNCRDILAGLGFIEVMGDTLVARRWQYKLMRTSGDPVVLKNPISREYNIFRDSLLPGLIKILQTNKPYSLPQKIFDIGDISRLDSAEETKATREVFLSGAIIHSKADFVEIKSNLEAILQALGKTDYEFVSIEHPSFFDGRCASIVIDKQKVGLFGEVHPEVLTNFELENPVAAFELEIEKIMLKKKS